ncbi:restriction endonuclease subunit S [Aeromonas dhakensis]|uniref:restriction endonuclease subunit S n=1 Tax=Aeromonas dhakensis TaxID=196024 RepID=UPI001CF05A0C|nr:restriction endonuclease subunit S [Aeromonas dhakensis]UCM46386.1 restriction endonuclease subunit S [Aeromonas dhakensis]
MSVEKNVPEIRFKGFNGEWVEKPLNHEVELFSGLTYSPKDIRKEGVFVIRSSNVKNGQIVQADNVYVNPEVVNCSNVQKGDIIVVVRNGSRSLIGKHAQVHSLMNDTVIGAFMTGIRAGHPEFINALFDTAKFTAQVEKNLGATINQITNGAFNSMVFMFPEEQEKNAIGTYFQKLDNLINQHQQKHAKLSNIKKAMLEKMFPKPGKTTPEIRFKGFSGEWEEKELGTDVAEIIGGGTPSTSISEFWNGDIDWYSPTEIGDNVYAEGSQKKITALGLINSSAKILPAGNTVLFTSRAGIGHLAILARPGATNQGFQSFVVKEGFSPYFIYSAGKQIKEYALKHASGSTFLEISGKQLGRMKMLIPCEKEQAAIGNYFQKLDSLLSQHQQQITKLNNIKQACLRKMFI